MILTCGDEADLLNSSVRTRSEEVVLPVSILIVVSVIVGGDVANGSVTITTGLTARSVISPLVVDGTKKCVTGIGADDCKFHKNINITKIL